MFLTRRFFTLLLASVVMGQVADFCWKNTYGRGVGTIPTECVGKTKMGALCYDDCPTGYSRYGFDCHQQCTQGFTSQGLFCRRLEYGRGAGYPWKFRDGFSDSGMFSRCESVHGAGNCQKTGAIVYPKCRSGYYHFGCCICRPYKPDCRAEGYNGGIDLSCAKYIIIGSPSSKTCGTGLVKDGGLCYTECSSNHDGVGPVCWGRPPAGWVNCGMGATPSSGKCASIVFDQISSVADVALNIATFGSSSLATKTISTIEDTEQLRQTYARLKKLYEDSEGLRELVEKGKQAYDLVATAKDAGELADSDPDQVTPEDMVRISAAIAALADPSGISGIIASYTYPLCSAIS